jgi:hypothetical protein
MKHILAIIQFGSIARLYQLTNVLRSTKTKSNKILKIFSPSTPLVLALFNHLLTCVGRNRPVMFSNVLNKILESDEYSPTSEIFLITMLYCIFDLFGNLLLTNSKLKSYAINTTFI